MTVKEFLQRGKNLNVEAEQLKSAKKRAWDMACGITVSTESEKVQTSTDNSVEKKMIEYAEFSKMLDIKIAELIEHQKKMLQIINKIDNTSYRTLLIARYINCKTWEQIAEDMGYSDKWVRTSLHGRALTVCGKYFNEI